MNGFDDWARLCLALSATLALSGCPEASNGPVMNDMSAQDGAPIDAGEAADSALRSDAGMKTDAMPSRDGGPQPDALPMPDARPHADAASVDDAAMPGDAAIPGDAAPEQDAALVVDAALPPDAAPDWGPPPENLRQGSWTGHVMMGGSMWGSGWQFPFGYGLSYYTRVFRPLDSVPAGGQMGLTSQWLSTPADTETCGADYQTIEGGLFIREHVTGPSHFPKFMIGTGNHC